MDADGALAGLRLLEVGGFISAPYGAKLLADLGADVIKVEPRAGDRARSYGPFRGDVPDPECSGLYLYLNTNKRGVTLDLRVPAGRDLLAALVRRADVVIENLSAEEVEQAGLSYAAFREWNPEVIVTSISPFGRSGPRAHWKGDGLQASAGGNIALRIGDPTRYPLHKPLEEEEFLGGVHAAAATLMSVLFRDAGGPGQHADISIQDLLAAVSSGSAVVSAVYGNRAISQRAGHRVNAFYPWTILPVADGYMEFVTLQRRQWDAFLAEVGSPAWKDDPRYEMLSVVTAQGNADALDADLLSSVGHMTRAEIWDKARRARAPFQPVNRIDEIVDSEHMAVRGFFVDIPDGNGDPVRAPGPPYRPWGTPWAIRRPSPRLGEHNAEIYGDELGTAPEVLASLARAGVI